MGSGSDRVKTVKSVMSWMSTEALRIWTAGTLQ